ncbi:protein kinase [candidate division KSB1 bacterium]|nr:protein kinase [candidate division KSB1 bacterium]
MINETVSHYKILERIGGGGMGEVYAAEDLKLGRKVALKFLSPELTRDPASRERLIQEARTASLLDHVNICTVYEIGETDEGHIFICMAYYAGETLKQMLENGSLPPAEAIGIVSQIAYGLAGAHEKGIIHRDIKASNIIVTGEGVVKIVDFGLARLIDQTRITQSGATVGTIAYMSPEQARGDEVDHRTDLWSMGVVLYECLTGKLPFRGHHEQAVVFSILNNEPEPISKICADIPPELESIVLKLLMKNTDQRYQRAADAAEDLQWLQQPASTSKKRKVPKIKRTRPPKRFPMPAIWALVLALIAIAVGTLFIIPRNEISFVERDWILITDFENLTDEGVFDNSLNTALTISIEQSRYVNALPRMRIRETLKRMKQDTIEHIDESIAREIAIREGITLLVVPGISKIGETYAISCKILDAHSAATLQSELFYAEGKDKILNALDRLCKNIRSSLGESHFAILKQNQPLVKVTTSSLEALRHYSVAVEKNLSGEFDDAKQCLENALRIDSSFISAKASLGILNFERFDRQRGIQLIEAASKRTEHLAVREKYNILRYYAEAVENDLDKAASYLKIIIDLYPDDKSAHHNLGWYYHQTGRYRDAMREYKEVIRIDRHSYLTYHGMLWLYLNEFSEIDSAIQLCRRVLALNDRLAFAYDHLGWAYLALDSLTQARDAFQRAVEINPRSAIDLYRLAHVHRLLGNYSDAVKPLKKLIEIAPDDSWALYHLGVNYQLLGNHSAANTYFMQFKSEAEKWLKSEPENGKNYFYLAFVLSRLGKEKTAYELGKKAAEVDSTLHFEFAQLCAIQQKKQQALDYLELEIKSGYHNYIWIKIHPDFQALYSEPRFQNLVASGLQSNPKGYSFRSEL